jgi:K+-transporting ATPase KdpF subunit
MKTGIIKLFGLLTVIPGASAAPLSNGPVSYLIGGIIGLFILGYLIYSLIKPKKF